MNKIVWFIFQEASPIGQGAYSRHYYFAQQLKERGYTTKIITSSFHHFQTTESREFNGWFSKSIEGGIDTSWIKVNKYRSAHSYRRVLAWILFMLKLFILPFKDNTKPDYIVYSSPSLHGYLGAKFLRSFYKKTKLILEIRDIWPETLVEVGKISNSNILIRWMYEIEKKAYKSSDYIISTLPFANERISKVLTHTQFKFKCIPQGIAQVTSENKKLSESIINSIPRDKFIIGYSGTIGASNALETIVLAAKSILEKNNRIHFLIIGGGAQLKRLKSLAYGLKNVDFIPHVEKKYLSSILEKCDVLYDSTKDANIYKYGLSRNKWIDYMLAAKPMLVSYSGRQTMINEAKNGFFVESENVLELENAIIAMSKMSVIDREQMGERGKNFILKNRSFEKLTSDLIDIFNNC